VSAVMGSEIFLTSLDLSASCALGKTIFKKQFYDSAGLSDTDKKLISNNVEKVIWQYCLKPETINIQPYVDEIQEYPEVQVVEARLQNDNRHKRVAEIIMRAIPYPMILQMTHGNNLMVAAGMPRINMADRQKHTIEEFVYSFWIDSQNLSQMDKDFLTSIQASKLSFTNFYRFYSDFIDQLHLYNAGRLVGKTQQDVDPQEAQRLHTEVMGIERELVFLRAQLNRENMFNRKVELNIQIKKVEKRKALILKSLVDEQI
jgi:hypothetical protein